MQRNLLSILLCFVAAIGISAQTTEFTYQGSLKDGVNLANGNYDFEFLLFDALSSGAQVGSTLTRGPVAVSSGIFTVSLDFGSEFPGASRFLEIHVRPTGGGSFNTLSPRQQIDSAPYSVKSLSTDTAVNADQLGGVAASQYVVTTDPRMTDARSPTAGSADYIQNQNAVTQSSSNFSISGTGTANIFNAATQYNISGNRVLSNPGLDNLFAGVGAGQNTGVGFRNSFFGRGAGNANSSGNYNVFLGYSSGTSNSTGSNNTYIGAYAGINSPVSLTYATAIGADAYVSQNDSLVLGKVGLGQNGTSVGIGTTAPEHILHVNGFNEILSTGLGAGFRFRNRSYFSTAADDWVWYSQDNVARFFRSGVGDLLSVTPGGYVGIGTNTPGFKLDVVGRLRFRQNAGDTGSVNTAGFWFFQNTPNTDRSFVGMETDDSVGFFGNNGGGWGLAMNTQTGITSIRSLAVVGVTSLCRNGQNEVSFCSSSLKYKTNITGFSPGLSFINKLRPISFDWKNGGMKDVGFGAEDIANIDPRFVTYNDKGEVEGVKYDRLSVAFVNAFKEQQAQIEKYHSQIEALKQQIKEQKEELEAFKALVCSLQPAAEACRPKN